MQARSASERNPRGILVTATRIPLLALRAWMGSGCGVFSLAAEKLTGCEERTFYFRSSGRMVRGRRSLDHQR